MSLRQDLAQIIQTSSQANDTSYHLDFVLRPDFPIFAGHFPDHPVLPAMVQMIMAEMTLEAWQKKSLQTTAVRQGKFLRPIVPPATVRCTVAVVKSQAQATLSIGSEICAQIAWTYKPVNISNPT